jgi:hypothetical protein
MMAETQLICLSPIGLKWEEWVPLKRLINKEVTLPQEPGVYELKSVQAIEAWQRLYIGQTDNLHHHLVEEFLEGKKNTIDDQMNNLLSEGVENVEVRWACTRKPAAIGEHLLQIYMRDHRAGPKHNHAIPPHLPGMREDN